MNVCKVLMRGLMECPLAPSGTTIGVDCNIVQPVLLPPFPPSLSVLPYESL